MMETANKRNVEACMENRKFYVINNRSINKDTLQKIFEIFQKKDYDIVAYIAVCLDNGYEYTIETIRYIVELVINNIKTVNNIKKFSIILVSYKNNYYFDNSIKKEFEKIEQCFLTGRQISGIEFVYKNKCFSFVKNPKIDTTKFYLKENIFKITYDKDIDIISSKIHEISSLLGREMAIQIDDKNYQCLF